MRIFKFALWTGFTLNCENIICKAVAGSFVVPSVTLSTVNIVESILWKDSEYYIGNGMSMSAALQSLIFPLLTKVQLDIERLLIHAFDLTLILLQAFHKCTHRCVGPPLMKDIKEAAFAYRELSEEVHGSIKGLIPSNFLEVFQFRNFEFAYRNLLQKYTSRLLVES